MCLLSNFKLKMLANSKLGNYLMFFTNQSKLTSAFYFVFSESVKRRN